MKFGVLCGCALLALAQAVQAQPRGQYDPRDPVVIDPARSYIFYRTNVRGAMVLLRQVSDREREATRLAAFDRARAGHGRGVPQEVTIENFPEPAPESARWVEIWWQPRFTAGDEGNSYFREVEPGTYVLYGNVMLGNNGSGWGACLCMGSLRFEARPGQIVDLGEIRYEADPTPGRRPWGVSVVPFAPTMTVPPRLAGLPRVPAEFHAAGKLPNYFGVEIERHPAMPGVLAYERDRVIDARAGRPVAPGR